MLISNLHSPPMGLIRNFDFENQTWSTNFAPPKNLWDERSS
jgi:hypothetical protein